MTELTDKQRAAVYRELAMLLNGWPHAQDEVLDLADELDPPTIDKVDGWEVKWCAGWQATRTEDGNVFCQWRGDIPFDRNNLRYPWPERPKPPLIPDGWTLMRSDELKVGVHEVFNPERPEGWEDSGVERLANFPYTCLVVARERSDR